jgi:hypothetical protein
MHRGVASASANRAMVGEAASLALAIAVAVLPADTTMVYNQILLVPAGLVLIGRVPKSYPAHLARMIALGLTFWGFLAPFVVIGAMMVVGRHEELLLLPFNNILLPVALTAALCADELCQEKVNVTTAAGRVPMAR